MVKLSLTSIALASLLAMGVAAKKKSKDQPTPSSSTAVAPTGTVKEATCERNLKVTNQSDLDAISNCATFKGNIEINGLSAVPNLHLNGVEHIIGDLVLTNNNDLVSFEAAALTKVEGALRIENHILLNQVQLPHLKAARLVSFSVLPALDVIAFPSGLTHVEQMKVEDTRAPTVHGFLADRVGTFMLLNNNYMKSFDFNSVKDVTGEMLIMGNNHALTFQANQLAKIQKATFFNLYQLDMPALTEVQNDISFHENDFLSLNMDSVENIGGTMTIANNNKLKETSFKKLHLINGALSIGNNTQLTAIDGFPALKAVHGTIDLAGGFSKYHIPSLQDVRGGMRLQTTSSQFGCADIERKLRGENVVKGTTWSCTASMQETNLVPTMGQSPNSGNNNNKQPALATGNNNNKGSGNTPTTGNTNMGNAIGQLSSSAASSFNVMATSGSLMAGVAIGFVYNLI
ncbi:hypothetical protein BDF20DRAFT_308337 [Mycotypha africana]|uniref:uncharacterized protein n=1 Tax=Mycotypha africana TaxID=64632 RepID=UPI002301A32E|nr:uncharacterized protein BDF20DRAFT_308337 [Mycotypha africana]KAI8988147.1 hypothetical protein BDF20DRAFT_308337 [Mycotypha africana]